MHHRVTAEMIDRLLSPVLVLWLWLQALLLPHVEPSRLVVGLVGTALCAGPAFRRRHPLVVGFGTQLLLTVVSDVVHLPAGPVTVAWFCALYALSVWTSELWFAASVVFVVVANGGTGLLHPTDPGVGAQFGLGAAGVMVLVRLVVGGRDRRLRLARREQDVAAREAVVEERARIARELHDVIAHHVSTMVVQAGAERRVLPVDREQTREVLGTIEGVGRGALTEMRRMVAMLRAEPADALVPQPTLHDVPLLVEQMRAAGLAVELRQTGEPRQLPVGIELSAYRIVQEALTNSLKHGGGSDAVVDMRYGANSLELEVRDHGSPTQAEVAGGGHGLVGMRERVAMYGGRFEAGRLAGGGYAVRALLPVR